MGSPKPKKAGRPSRDLSGFALRSIERGDLEAALRSLGEAERRGRRLESVRKRLAAALSAKALSADGGTRSARLSAQREACALTPRDPIAWLDLGRLLYRVGDFPGALEAFGEAERAGHDPSATRRLSSLARVRLGERNGGRKADPISTLIDLVPDAPETPADRDPAARLAAAMARIGTGDLRSAREGIAAVLERGSPLQPIVARNAHHYLGRLLLLEGDHREAAVHLVEAARLEETEPLLPRRSAPHLLRALLGAALEAEEAVERCDLVRRAEGARSNGPRHAAMIEGTRRAIVRKLITDGRLREVIPLLDAERKREPASPRREKDLALARERLGENDKAIRHWERAIRLGKKLLHGRPADPSAKMFLLAALRHAARLDRQEGRTAEAARKLSFSLQLDPDRLAVRKELGEMLLGLGKYREALRCLSPLRDDPKGGAEVWTQMGIACDRLGRSDDAISLWERASARHPLAKRLLLARLHERFLLRFRAGDLGGAREEVDRARSVDPADRDGILDDNCLTFACGENGSDRDPEVGGPAVGPLVGRRGCEFSPSPEVPLQVGRSVRSLCCGDGTRCEAVRALLARLSEGDGEGRAAPIRRALIADGCRLVTESLAASLEDEDDGGAA